MYPDKSTFQAQSPTRLGMLLLLLGLLHSLPIASLQAAEPKPTGPIKISADALELNQKEQSTTYTGHVVMTQGDMRLEADTLKVFTKAGQLEHIEMRGQPAHFVAKQKEGGLVEGQANEVDYFSKTARIVLRGDGRLAQQGNTIANDYIEYDLTSGNLVAGGKAAKRRVEVTFEPAQ